MDGWGVVKTGAKAEIMDGWGVVKFLRTMNFRWANSDFSPKYLGRGFYRKQNPPPKGLLRAKLRRAKLLKISAGTYSYALCPRWAPAASFAWFCILIVWLYIFLQPLLRHGRTYLFRSMWNSFVEVKNWDHPSKCYVGPTQPREVTPRQTGGLVI